MIAHMATPAWLQGVIDTNQTNQNGKDADNLKAYEQAAAEWVKSNTHNREIGLALTAPPPLPTVTTWFDGGGYADTRTVPNPAAVTPVLPPWTPPTPGGGGIGTAGGAARDEMMFDLLIAIQRDVAQIKAAVLRVD